MANELVVLLDPVKDAGLTVVARVFDEDLGAQIGSDIVCVESAVRPGGYVGDAPSELDTPGEYPVDFYVGADLVASGSLDWSGTREVEQGDDTFRFR